MQLIAQVNEKLQAERDNQKPQSRSTALRNNLPQLSLLLNIQNFRRIDY